MCVDVASKKYVCVVYKAGKKINKKTMSDRDADFTIKIAMVGDCGVGKTALAKRFSDGTFSARYDSTIGVEFQTRLLRINPPSRARSVLVKLHIWDTAGQETYAALTQLYFRNLAGAIIVYDVASRPEDASASIEKWRARIQDANPETIVTIWACGNKVDLHPPGDSLPSAIRTLHGHGTASAKSGIGVNSVFTRLCEEILDQVFVGTIDLSKSPGIAIHRDFYVDTKSEHNVTRDTGCLLNRDVCGVVDINDDGDERECASFCCRVN